MKTAFKPQIFTVVVEKFITFLENKVDLIMALIKKNSILPYISRNISSIQKTYWRCRWHVD